MGKVTYSPGIQYVQGSLSKPKKKDGHNHGDYLIGTHRTAPTTNPECTRIYIRKADTYVHENFTARQLESQARLAQASAATKTRLNNISTIQADREAFEAQKNLAGGKKTLYSYIFNLEYDKLRG